MWPEAAGDDTPVTKLDLARYYEAVSPWLIRHLQGDGPVRSSGRPMVWAAKPSSSATRCRARPICWNSSPRIRRPEAVYRDRPR